LKYSLLDLTQIILSSMDGDEVNSIGDSVESQQVALTIKTVYNDLAAQANLPEHYTLFNLDSVGISSPTTLSKPEGIDDILWFKYNKLKRGETNDKWSKVSYIEPSEFVDLVQTFPGTGTNVISYVVSYGSSSVKLYCKNDIAPTYWTSFDDLHIVCDSYDAALETNLQQSKTSCYGRRLVDFLMQDTFVPPLDEQQFSLLLNEAKAMCWAEMKQAVHAKSEKKARNGWISMQHTKYDTKPPKTALDRIPNYGRK
jgi:hypothetical protein